MEIRGNLGLITYVWVAGVTVVTLCISDGNRCDVAKYIMSFSINFDRGHPVVLILTIVYI